MERLRKRKLRGGKRDTEDARGDDALTKGWRVELTAASRALAIRWVRAARDGLDGTHRHSSPQVVSIRYVYLSLLLRPVLETLTQTFTNCTSRQDVLNGRLGTHPGGIDPWQPNSEHADQN